MAADIQDIVALEKSFWQALIDKDEAAARSMIAEDCVVTNPAGTVRIDPDKYVGMMRDGQWSLDGFEFSEVNVLRPVDDTAIIAYRVHQTGSMKGERMDLTCADSSTWVREDGAWKCALHTETIVGHMPLTN